MELIDIDTTDVINAIKYLKKYKTETNMIEAKAACEGFPKKCYDTFSSFPNKYGGIIIFGISEENKKITLKTLFHNMYNILSFFYRKIY